MSNRSFSLPRGRSWLAVATSLLVISVAACASEGPDDEHEQPSPPSPIPGPDVPLPDDPPPSLSTALGPEVGLDAVNHGPAAFGQRNPVAAFDGTSYFVVWTDERPVHVYGARVGQTGAALDPVATPLPIDSERPFSVASDGNGFLIVGNGLPPSPGANSPGLVAVRVSAAGAVLGTISLMDSPTWGSVEVASSGSGYLVVWSDGTSEPRSLYRARVASDGTVLDPGGVLFADDESSFGGLAFDGTSYVVTWRSVGLTPGRMAAIAPSGAVLQEAALPIAPERMACNAGQCFLLWASGPDPDTGSFPGDMSGSWMTPQGTLLNPQGVDLGYFGEGRLSVGLDGPDALVIWSLGSYDCSVDATYVTRVTPGGAVVGSAGALLRERASQPVLARGGEQALILWSEDRYNGNCGGQENIYAARLTSDGTQTDGDGSLVSLAANGQLDPSIAFDGQSFLLAWSDERNLDDGAHWDVYATRVSLDGQMLDPASTLLGTGPGKQHRTRAAFDGVRHQVVWWGCSHSSWHVECSAAGARLDAGVPSALTLPYDIASSPYMPPALSGGDGAAVVMPFYDDFYGDAALVAAPVGPGGASGPSSSVGSAGTRIASAFDGENHLAVWVPKDHEEAHLLAGRVAPDGTVLDPGGFAITPLGSDVRGLSVAFGAGAHLVAWHEVTDDIARILATRVSPQGVVLDAEPVVVAEYTECSRVDLGPSAVAFDGERFVLGWRACGAESVDLFGAVIDPQGTLRGQLTITSDANEDHPPALSGAGAGSTLIAYASFRAEAPFGTWRLFTRRLDVTEPAQARVAR